MKVNNIKYRFFKISGIFFVLWIFLTGMTVELKSAACGSNRIGWPFRFHDVFGGKAIGKVEQIWFNVPMFLVDCMVIYAISILIYFFMKFLKDKMQKE